MKSGWCIHTFLLALWLGAGTGCFGGGQHQAQPTGTLLDDKVTAARVEDRLRKELPDHAHNLHVGVTNSTVYLTGTLPSSADRQRAIASAQGVDRVKKVEDQIRVLP